MCDKNTLISIYVLHSVLHVCDEISVYVFFDAPYARGVITTDQMNASYIYKGYFHAYTFKPTKIIACINRSMYLPCIHVPIYIYIYIYVAYVCYVRTHMMRMHM